MVSWSLMLSRSVPIALALVVAGCAKSSNEISTTYVSPLQYQHMSCGEINSELVRVSSRVAELGGTLDEAASNDAAITGLGVVLFWPALFALGGTGSQEAEYGRLKGEYDALNQLAIQRNCVGVITVIDPQPGRGIAKDGPTAANLQKAAGVCRQQGIPENTENFGKCVLNLSK